MAGIAILRWITGGDMIIELWYVLFFVLVSAYGGALLDVKREVCYVLVGIKNVSPAKGPLWVSVWNRALKGGPRHSGDAIGDLATGHVRQHGTGSLAVPVMSVRPTVEFARAQAFFMWSWLRGPILSCSYFLNAGIEPHWVTAYAVSALVQARLQKSIAQYFLTDAVPYQIVWFRKLPTCLYEEEVEEYRRELS